MELPPAAGAGPETTGNQERHGEEREQQRADKPRIYVASLSDYNNGILHGVWVDVDQDTDALHAEAGAMLARSPTGGAEEFAIHDFEGFGPYPVGEYDSLDRLSRIARGIGEHGPAFGAWAAQCGTGPDALERFDDVYLGDWPSTEAYADDLLESLGLQETIDRHIPDSLQPYVTIDAESFARDLELSGDITTVSHDQGVWIFDGRF